VTLACAHCGAVLRLGARLCIKCGNKVVQPTEVPASPTPPMVPDRPQPSCDAAVSVDGASEQNHRVVRHCPACDVENLDRAEFCKSCGAAIPFLPAEVENTNSGTCLSCGYANNASANFCGACGVALRSGPPTCSVGPQSVPESLTLSATQSHLTQGITSTTAPSLAGAKTTRQKKKIGAVIGILLVGGTVAGYFFHMRSSGPTTELAAPKPPQVEQRVSGADADPPGLKDERPQKDEDRPAPIRDSVLHPEEASVALPSVDPSLAGRSKANTKAAPVDKSLPVVASPRSAPAPSATVLESATDQSPEPPVRRQAQAPEPPVRPQAQAQVYEALPAQRSIDETYNARTAATCEKGLLLGLVCREKIRFGLCDGKWTKTQVPGMTICYVRD